MHEINLEIPHRAATWSAPLLGKHGAYDKKRGIKDLIKRYLRGIYKGDLLSCYVGVTFEFIVAPPKSASKKKKERMLRGEERPTGFDVTNCQKLYEDCLKGIVLKDDRTVVITCAEKYYGPKDLVKIQIHTIPVVRG
jgi:Holliday junction resolvase RusA-like endonuclease